MQLPSVLLSNPHISRHICNVWITVLRNTCCVFGRVLDRTADGVCFPLVCSADTRLKEQREAMAVVSSDGSVLWIPMAIYKSTCSIDITHFPFDQQTCHLKFGSWTYDGFKLDLDFYDGLEQVDVTDYIESNEWGLIGHPAVKNVKYYPCCEEPYPDLTFTLQLKRIAAFYNYILILPCVLLSSLTLVIFWLPPESPAKMILGKFQPSYSGN